MAVLVLTNSLDATADYLCAKVHAAAVALVRLDSDMDLRRLSLEYRNGKPVLGIDQATYRPEDFSHVWLRRPEELRLQNQVLGQAEKRHITEEWKGALEGFLAHIDVCRWINHPARNAAASHKMEQLSRAKSLGFLVPETLITNKPEAMHDFWHECEGEVAVKPIFSGYLERDAPAEDSQVYTNRVQPRHLQSAHSLLPICPTLFQRIVRKAMDVRITIVDSAVYPVGITADDGGRQRLDIRRNNMNDVKYSMVSVPPELRARLMELVASYGLRFAAVDMAIDEDGRWFFFEVNPNGQWAWLDIAGITSIAAGFVRMFSQGKGNRNV